MWRWNCRREKTDNRKKQDPGRTAAPDAARLAIVTGSHGDELEGQYICYETARRLKEGLQFLSGTVDIYPALNPLESMWYKEPPLWEMWI